MYNEDSKQSSCIAGNIGSIGTVVQQSGCWTQGSKFSCVISSISLYFLDPVYKGICGQVLIDTLNFDPQTIILNRHSIDTLVDTPSTSQLTVGHEFTNFWLLHISWLTHSQLTTDCWLSVDQSGMSIKYRLRGRSRVSIESIDQHLTADALSSLDLIIFHGYKIISILTVTQEMWQNTRC